MRIVDDVDALKNFQEGHGGYQNHMLVCCGVTGIVVSVDDDGDVKVRAVMYTARWRILACVCVMCVLCTSCVCACFIVGMSLGGVY